MKLSLSEKYCLSTINEQGFLPYINDVSLGLASAGLVDLVNYGVIEVIDGKARILKNLDYHLDFLYSLYQMIGRYPKLKILSEFYAITWRREYINELTNNIKNSLIEKGCMKEDSKRSRGTRTIYILNGNVTNPIVDSMINAAEYHEDEQSAIDLICLLYFAGMLKRYFRGIHFDKVKQFAKNSRYRFSFQAANSMFMHINQQLAGYRLVAVTPKRKY